MGSTASALKDRGVAVGKQVDVKVRHGGRDMWALGTVTDIDGPLVQVEVIHGLTPYSHVIDVSNEFEREYLAKVGTKRELPADPTAVPSSGTPPAVGIDPALAPVARPVSAPRPTVRPGSATARPTTAPSISPVATAVPTGTPGVYLAADGVMRPLSATGGSRTQPPKPPPAMAAPIPVAQPAPPVIRRSSSTTPRHKPVRPCLGDYVDVLDMYQGQQTGAPTQHWTVGTFAAVEEGRAKIHFEGWGEEMDTWIPAYQWAHRLAELGTYSTSRPRPQPRPYCEGGLMPVKVADVGRDAFAGAIGGGGPPVPSDWILRVGDHVDALVSTGKWREAEVRNIVEDESNGTVEFVRIKLLENAKRMWLRAVDRIAPNGKFSSIPCHDYTKGSLVDVKDIWKDRWSGRRQSKWRKAEILNANPRAVYVNFLGWEAYYNMWIDMDTEEGKGRVKPYGAMTEVESDRERVDRETEEFFNVAMVSSGLEIFPVDRDGNCLFRAVAHQVYGTVDRHLEVRTRVCDHMRRYRDMYSMVSEEADFDQYLKKMREPMKWGGNPEQLAIEEIFDRPLEIYSREDYMTSGEVKILPFHFEGDLPLDKLRGVEPIRLSYHGKSHYNSVVKSGVIPLGERRDEVILRNRLMREASSPRGLIRRPTVRMFDVGRDAGGPESKGTEDSKEGGAIPVGDDDPSDDEVSKVAETRGEPRGGIAEARPSELRRSSSGRSTGSGIGAGGGGGVARAPSGSLGESRRGSGMPGAVVDPDSRARGYSSGARDYSGV